MLAWWHQAWMSARKNDSPWKINKIKRCYTTQCVVCMNPHSRHRASTHICAVYKNGVLSRQPECNDISGPAEMFVAPRWRSKRHPLTPLHPRSRFEFGGPVERLGAGNKLFSRRFLPVVALNRRPRQSPIVDTSPCSVMSDFSFFFLLSSPGVARRARTWTRRRGRKMHSQQLWVNVAGKNIIPNV